MTGVATFQTLSELVRLMDEEIHICQELIDDSGDKLGKLLRLGDIRSMNPANSAASKNSREPGWTPFRELVIYRGSSPKAQSELYFAAMGQLKVKLARLEKLKGTIGKLSEFQSPSKVSYLVYFGEGVPERVLLRQKDEVPKFVFENAFLVQ